MDNKNYDVQKYKNSLWPIRPDPTFSTCWLHRGSSTCSVICSVSTRRGLFDGTRKRSGNHPAVPCSPWHARRGTGDFESVKSWEKSYSFSLTGFWNSKECSMPNQEHVTCDEKINSSEQDKRDKFEGLGLKKESAQGEVQQINLRVLVIIWWGSRKQPGNN